MSEEKRIKSFGLKIVDEKSVGKPKMGRMVYDKDNGLLYVGNGNETEPTCVNGEGGEYAVTPQLKEDIKNKATKEEVKELEKSLENKIEFERDLPERADALGQEIFELETDNKTLIGAINEINGKANSVEDAKSEIDERVDERLADLDGKASKEYVDAQLGSINVEKATKQEVEVERQRINSLTVLSEGSTTGDAELIDGRVGADGVTYNNLGSAIRTQINNINENINNITPDQNIYINGNVLSKVTNKQLNRSFSSTGTFNRYWDFADLLGGNIDVSYGDDLKLYIKGGIADVSGKLKSLQYQINWYKEDEKTISSSTSYYTVKFDDVVIIKIPNEETKFAKIVIYETLTEAHGESFTDELNIDLLLLYQGYFSFNETFLPQLQKVDVMTNNYINKNEYSKTINTFTFLQGNNVNGVTDASKTNVRTELIHIDFAKAVITCPQDLQVKCLTFDKNGNYLRFGADISDNYEFIPENDEFYYVVVVSLKNKETILAEDFDSSCIKINRYSSNDILSVIDDYQKYNNAMFYQDRLTSKSGSYWIYKKNADTGIYDNYAESRIADILSADGVPTIFITDTHWRTTSNSKFSWDLCGLFASRIHCNNIILGGDVLTQHGTKEDAKSQLVNEISPFTNRFNTNFKYVFGNHDLNMANVGQSIFTNDESTYRVEYKDVYRIGVIHLKNIVNFDDSRTLQKNSEEWYRNRLHYYYDDMKNRVRYIIMDSGTSKDALSEGGTPTRLQYQYDWMADVLKSTPIGYHIMVIAHQFWNIDSSNEVRTIASTTQGDNVSKILNAYQNKEVITGNDSVVSFSYDFSNDNGCPIIAMVSGHVHFDYCGKVNGIQQIVTTCDAIDKTNHYNVDMVAATTTEHAFDIIKVDKFTRTVKCFRIGAGEDREFNY